MVAKSRSIEQRQSDQLRCERHGIFGKKSGVPARTHKAYFPTAQTSNPTNLVLLMLYLGNVSL
jgi:hypothetical protein